MKKEKNQIIIDRLNKMDFFYVFEDCKTKEISKIIIDYNSNQLTKTLEEFQ